MTAGEFTRDLIQRFALRRLEPADAGRSERYLQALRNGRRPGEAAVRRLPLGDQFTERRCGSTFLPLSFC